MTRLSPEREKEIRSSADFGYARQVISELLQEIDALRDDYTVLRQHYEARVTKLLELLGQDF